MKLGNCLKVLKTSSHQLIAPLMVAMLASIVGLTFAILMKYMIDILASGEEKQLYDLILFAISFGVVRGLAPVLNGLREYYTGKLVEAREKEFRAKFIEENLHAGYEENSRKNIGMTMRIMHGGIQGHRTLIRSIFSGLLPTLFDVVFIIVTLVLLVDISIAILIAAIILIYGSVIIAQTKQRVPYIRAIASQDKEINGAINNYLSNHEGLLGWGRVHGALDGYKSEAAALFDTFRQNRVAILKHNIVLSIVIMLSMVLVLIYVGYLIGSGQETLGSFLMIVGFMSQIFLPLNAIGFSYRQIINAEVDLEKAFNYVHNKSSTQQSSPVGIPHKSLLNIEFSNVSCEVNGISVLEDLSFEIKSSSIAIIKGTSGSGKTTILRLISGLLKPSSGVVRINGINIQQLSPVRLSESIVVTSQESLLFNGTLRDNLIFYGEKLPDNDILNMLEMIGLKEFIDDLPDGLDTFIGDRGQMLSGGQRQKVMIGRALLAKPYCLVLDEPSTGLDEAAVKSLKELISKLSEKTQLLIVTHDQRLMHINNTEASVVDLDKKGRLANVKL
ncbi:hypothetical protein BGP77_06600 [Saccharospirillum sp. MSK14-1]|uniref:ATP-binding cassette domain-containing protein n=1 Tax=Saccharospirillum sp. MSK14-1 TaxID=1897632 RepID=UPI000D33B870|nr:ABC transporter ATP-binding protein [Saccharospirillum sp. MSK14-1]PTY36949.1 hypothetical protein BGP77_06600 [Saccharospirillum sp. MSK14-1]